MTPEKVPRCEVRSAKRKREEKRRHHAEKRAQRNPKPGRSKKKGKPVDVRQRA